MVKRILQTYVDHEVVVEAKGRGINISALVRNALSLAVNPDIKTETIEGENQSLKKKVYELGILLEEKIKEIGRLRKEIGKAKDISKYTPKVLPEAV